MRKPVSPRARHGRITVVLGDRFATMKLGMGPGRLSESGLEKIEAAQLSRLRQDLSALAPELFSAS
jgi:hypothetical protein